jgi:hypothetical protein
MNFHSSAGQEQAVSWLEQHAASVVTKPDLLEALLLDRGCYVQHPVAPGGAY